MKRRFITESILSPGPSRGPYPINFVGISAVWAAVRTEGAPRTPAAGWSDRVSARPPAPERGGRACRGGPGVVRCRVRSVSIRLRGAPVPGPTVVAPVEEGFHGLLHLRCVARSPSGDPCGIPRHKRERLRLDRSTPIPSAYPPRFLLFVPHPAPGARRAHLVPVRPVLVERCPQHGWPALVWPWAAGAVSVCARRGRQGAEAADHAHPAPVRARPPAR